MNVEEYKKKLEKTKKDIEEELDKFAKKDDQPRGDWETKYPSREVGSMEEEADEVQEYDNLLPVEYSLEIRLKNINKALEKIKKGSYGKCEKCGKEIEEGRLYIEPEAELCANCKK